MNHFDDIYSNIAMFNGYLTLPEGILMKQISYRFFLDESKQAKQKNQSQSLLKYHRFSTTKQVPRSWR